MTFSVTHERQSDEIDIVAIGPPGVRVIEVKHWTDAHRGLADRAADLLTMKARKIGTTLRKTRTGPSRMWMGPFSSLGHRRRHRVSSAKASYEGFVSVPLKIGAKHCAPTLVHRCHCSRLPQ